MNYPFYTVEVNIVEEPKEGKYESSRELYKQAFMALDVASLARFLNSPDKGVAA